MVVSNASTPALRRHGCGDGFTAARSHRRRVDVARKWGHPAAVRLRSRASVRFGAAPGRGYRCRHRRDRGRARGRNRVLRRLRSLLG